MTDQDATARKSASRLLPGGHAGVLDLHVYRGPESLIWMRAVFALGAVGLGLAGIFKFPSSVGVHVVIPLVCIAIAMLWWVTMVLTAVRVRDGRLVIDNLLVRHVIPWERFGGLFVEPGRGMFALLDDGWEIKCAAYGPSLAHAMTRYAGPRNVLEHIREDCRQARSAYVPADPAPAYRCQVNVPWRPLLAFAVLFEAVSWAVFAVNGAFTR